VEALLAYKNGTTSVIGTETKSEFNELRTFAETKESIPAEKKMPFTPAFLKKNEVSSEMNEIVRDFVSGQQNAGSCLAKALELDELCAADRKVALALLPLCLDSENKHGLISVLRTEHLKGYVSVARKQMFMIDFIENGPQI